MPGLPVETIGKLLIVDTKETASEALVINSVRELQVGDHIEMLMGGGPGFGGRGPGGPPPNRRGANNNN